MRIGILGPIATSDVAHLLTDTNGSEPSGYLGAPFMATLIESFLGLGHEVVAFTSDRTLDPRGDARVLNGPGFRLWLCPSRPNGTLPRAGNPIGRIWDFFRLERQQLAKAVANEHTDILHAHWTYEFAMVAADSGRPCLVTIHDAPGEVLRLAPTPYTLGRYLMAKKVLRSRTRFTAVSPVIAEAGQRWTKTVSIPVIANPLPAWLKTMAKAVPKNEEASSKAAVAMVLGAWTDFKNPLPGVQAFANLSRVHDKPVELRMYGADFSPGGKAEHEIRKAGISMHNIQLCGRLEHKALLREVSRASVFLHTSLTESFGMAVAEAMALGVPAIAGSESGAIPWLLQQGAAGQLVDVRRPDAIRAALSKALSGTCAEVVAQTKRARKTIWDMTDPRAVALRYTALYREVMQ